MDKRQAQFAMEAASWSSEKEVELNSLRAETKTLKQTMISILKGEQEKEEKNRVLKERIDLLEINYQKKANEFDNLLSEMQGLTERGNSSREKERVLKERIELLERNYQKKANEFDNLSSEMQGLTERGKRSRENERVLKERIELLEKNFQKKANEFDNLLSEMQGLTERGNSSREKERDAYWPTKLGEKWSSLFTDEWSEAYDEITMKSRMTKENYKVEKELFEIVKKCYSTCVELERQQMTDNKMHKWDSACCLHQQPSQLLEAALIKNCKQFERYRKPGSPNRVINFVKRCTELCWSMVIKEPSMVLVYDQLEGKPIDKNLFSPYTKNGSVIDFVVWPALILHNNGPILQKGSVQGKYIAVLADTQQKTDSRMTNSLAATSKGGSDTFIVRSDSVQENDDIKVIIPTDGANQSVKMKGGRNEQ